MLLAIIQGYPILSETTDCIQSTDYWYAKPDLLVNLGKSGDPNFSPARQSLCENSKIGLESDLGP
jgi:hypothetical protein